MLVEQLALKLKRVRVTTSTDANHPSRVPQVAEPSGIGDAAAQTTSAVIDCCQSPSGNIPKEIVLIPFGTGADTNTMLMRVIGWSKVSDFSDAEKDLWIPTTLAEFTCTLSTATGIAGKVVVATEIFCDTIAIVGTSGLANVTFEATSPADNTIASVAVKTQGCQKIEVTFGRNGSASGCNALYRLR